MLFGLLRINWSQDGEGQRGRGEGEGYGVQSSGAQGSWDGLARGPVGEKSMPISSQVISTSSSWKNLIRSNLSRGKARQK